MTELDKRILAGRVKDLRLHLEETPEKFAVRLNLPVTSIINWEIAIRRPSYEETLKLFHVATATGQRDLAQYFKERATGLFEMREAIDHYQQRTEKKA